MEDAPTALAGNAPDERMRPSGAGGWHRASLLAVLTFLAILLMACGYQGDPASGSGAGSQGPGTQAQAGSSAGPSRSGTVAFAQCVRSHGVPDFPDPQNGHFLISGTDQNNPNFNSAVQACQHLLGPGGASNSGGSNNSALLSFAQCMQTHGVPQFPDPTANGAIGLPSGVDPNTQQFQRSWQECQSKLPGNLQGQQP
jgi:hypothetical protein